ncbi:MAG: hypothetical protein ABSE67_18120 [Xanthobacteraceae bacterium]|jgi:hypothetical protein
MAKQTKRFSLDIDPDEFLERAIRTKPAEVEALIKRGKKRKPPGSRKPPGGISQTPVVSLRSRRMAKHNG